MKLESGLSPSFDDAFGPMRGKSFPAETSVAETEEPRDRRSFALELLNAVPFEGVAFLVASFTLRIFSASLAAPLLGVGISVMASRIVLKALEWYDNPLLVNLTKEACKFNKRYPKLQVIGFVCALALSFLSKTLSFLAGAALGCYGSILLDVEHFKLLQEANRKRPHNHHRNHLWNPS